MSFQNLVEGQCGGENALVQLSRQIQQNYGGFPSSRWQNLPADPSSKDDLVGEFMQEISTERVSVMRSFRMDTLLNEMQDLEKATHLARANANAAISVGALNAGPKIAPGVASIARGQSEAWAREYLSMEHRMLPSHGKAETDLRSSLDDIVGIEDAALGAVAAPPVFGFPMPMNHIPLVMAPPPVPYQIARAPQEHDIEKTLDLAAMGEDWIQEFLSKGPAAAVVEPADRLVDREGLQTAGNVKTDGETGSFFDALADEFDFDDLESGTVETLSPKTYMFEEENPVKDVENPFELGLKKLKEGEVSSAVLLFEAAVQKEPERAEAWLYLGTTQAKNEKDPAAIAALRRCLELDPSNPAALMALAVSFCNENQNRQVTAALQSWLVNNPKYESLLPAEQRSNDSVFVDSIGFVLPKEHSALTDAFLKAANLNPSDAVDPDVQQGLGVLFHMAGDYEKAVDCFRAALHVHLDDALLWNRLGATFANGRKPEEAVSAYHEALRLYPGFIRCRYNLGISCMNLKAYNEAAEHFLYALNIQASGRGPNGREAVVSDCIWNGLRMALKSSGASDACIAACRERNLESLNKEMKFSAHGGK